MTQLRVEVSQTEITELQNPSIEQPEEIIPVLKELAVRKIPLIVTEPTAGLHSHRDTLNRADSTTVRTSVTLVL